ncbi:MAG: hypothetical protein KDN19_20395 [Verrucomicrobiae bacterium]|nr:hypothetical protein [Verrucomicrobiae bacterium]
MKTLIAAIGLCLLVVPSSHSQENSSEPPAVGYIQLVNGVALKAPTYLSFGKLKMMGGKPMPPGGISGMLGMIAGPYDFEISNADCDPPKLTGTVEIEDGKTFAQIFYIESKTDKEGKMTHHLRSSTLTKQHEHTEPKLSLVSLSEEPLIQVEVGKNAYQLNSRYATEVPVAFDDELTIKQSGRVLDEITISTPAHYMAFFYDRSDGKGQEVVHIFNKKIVYEPLREDKDRENKETTE